MAAIPGRECEGNLFVGGALGVGAHWNLLLGNWLKAALEARRAVRTLRPLLSCSEFADEACFGLGMYEYAAAKLPWHMRWLSSVLIGGMNDRVRALDRLERAAIGARFLRSDAQGMLVVTYTYYDYDPVKAMKYADILSGERPDSPMAAGLRLQALCFASRYEEAAADARKCLDRDGTFPRETATYRYWEGIALLGLGNPAGAIEAFTAALAGPGRPPWMAAALLKRGCAQDLLGKRAEALRDYKAVSGRPDPWKEAARAALYKKKPFTMKDFSREISPRSY
jgi:tetratricopeptide (TPR) repeat protein